jgi:hypothetical protein
MRTNVIVRTIFEGIHSWRNCDVPEVNYLKYPHRHLFHIELKIPVKHNDRDVEFIKLKHQLNDLLLSKFPDGAMDQMSCEGLAEYLLKAFSAIYVSVFEDNENGAEVYEN